MPAHYTSSPIRAAVATGIVGASGHVVVWHKDGTMTGYKGEDTDDGRGGALLAAIDAMVDFDCIHLSPGVFDIDDERIALGNNVCLRGCGMFQTTIQSSFSGSNCIVNLNNSTTVSDLFIYATATGLAASAMPIGSFTDAFLDGKVERVRTLSDTYGLVIRSPDSWATCEHCQFEAKLLAVDVENDTSIARLYDCTILVAGPSSVSVSPNATAIAVSANANAVVEARRCRVVVSGSPANNRGAHATLGTIKLFDCDFDVSGTGAVDLVRTSGNLQVTGGRGSETQFGTFVESGTVNRMDAMVRLTDNSVSSLLPSSPSRILAYVSNGAANVRFAVSDGTNWRDAAGNVTS